LADAMIFLHGFDHFPYNTLFPESGTIVLTLYEMIEPSDSSQTSSTLDNDNRSYSLHTYEGTFPGAHSLLRRILVHLVDLNEPFLS
jgi:hypothetical protein